MNGAESSMLLQYDEAVSQLERLIQSAYDMLDHPEACQLTTSIRLAVPIETFDPLVWVSAQDSTTKIFWRDRQAQKLVAGVGSADIKQIKPGESIRGFLRTLEVMLNPVYPDLRWYGGFRFDRNRPESERDRHWDAFGDGLFVLPRFELIQSGQNAQLACNLVTDGNDREKMYEILDQLRALRFDLESTGDGSLRMISRSLVPARDDWGHMMAGALDAIEAGDIEKIVLARRTDFEFTGHIDHWSLVRRWQESIRDSYLWAIQVAKHNCFIGVSPERLYALQNGDVESEAVAGTRPRGTTDTEDSALRTELAESSKDQREFDYVSATVERALSLVCDEVTHDRKATVLALSNLQHLRCQYHGRLREDMRNGDIIEALHPTPAVGGTPRSHAVTLISKLEPFDRGWYAGPVGWIGPDAAEFAVGIRSGVINRDKLSLFAGAGVVAGSTIEGEWREIEHKSVSLSHTLGIS